MKPYAVIAAMSAAWMGITLAVLPEGCEPLAGWRVPAVVAWFFAAFAANDEHKKSHPEIEEKLRELA